MFQEPVFAVFGIGITNEGFGNCDFIWGQYALAKGVLAITPFQSAAAFDSHAGEQAKCVGSKDWGIFVGLRPDAVFVITQDNDTGLCTVRSEHLVGLYGQDTHGRDSPGGTLSTEDTISRQVNDVISVL